MAKKKASSKKVATSKVTSKKKPTKPVRVIGGKVTKPHSATKQASP